MDADKQVTMETLSYSPFGPDLLWDQVQELPNPLTGQEIRAGIVAGGIATELPKRPDLLAEALLQLHLRMANNPTAAVLMEEDEPLLPDRRNFPRQQSHGHASVLRSTNSETDSEGLAANLVAADAVSGEVLDLSRNGLAFVVLLPLKAGEKIRLRLSHPTQSLPHDVSAHVVRAASLGTGLWNIVAQFDEPLPFEAAYDLCEHLNPIAP